MNKREFKCVQLLVQLVEHYGLIGVKTSFQDQGATLPQTIRLKQICNQAKTKLTLKIGGPQAIRDIKQSTIIGVKGIVAPMVQSSFGVTKFIKAVKNNISDDVVQSLQLSINVQTVTGIKQISSILQNPCANDLYGVTIGRVDLVGSMGKDREYVNRNQLYDTVRQVFVKVKQKGIKCCIGGAISIKSLQFLNNLHSQGMLDKFETRYAMFDPSIALKKLSSALTKAQMFQYQWLMCKHQYYSSLSNGDLERINMIRNRVNESQKE